MKPHPRKSLGGDVRLWLDAGAAIIAIGATLPTLN